jgi:hypothetical protein
MSRRKSRRGELSFVEENEFEENGSEGKPYTSASLCGKARCMWEPQCGTAIPQRLPTSAGEGVECIVTSNFQIILLLACGRAEIMTSYQSESQPHGLSAQQEVILDRATPEIEKYGSH